MKLIPRVSPLVSSALLAGALVGCAVAPRMGSHHAHATTGAMDVQAHCEMHKKKMGSQPSAEQQAMMQEHLKSMPPEMRQRMQAIHEQCK